ncbi:hypothetical protein [Sphingomonas bacterium]|uniref:hypothetical protein n=1 Tax=Sphingomonas bacterium TaxID=1895847 RepID=UPI001575B2B0|nr:hypothetical protein [Sphingomonas bacterium]
MFSPDVTLALATTALAGLAMPVFALLHGWRGWLQLKHRELAATEPDGTPPSAAARIEIADLKERIRKLEAIAAGVDL